MHTTDSKQVIDSWRVDLLRSAVGIAHVLRSGLVMGYATKYFPWIVLEYHSDSNWSYGPLSDTLQAGAWFFPRPRSRGQVWTNHRHCYISFRYCGKSSHLYFKSIANTIGSFQFLPTGLHGLCFGCCFSGPPPLCSLINGPPIGVRFRKSLVIRLHSEIDQIHLSIEAQCVTTLLPLGDCHKHQCASIYTTWVSEDQINVPYLNDNGQIL